MVKFTQNIERASSNLNSSFIILTMGVYIWHNAFCVKITLCRFNLSQRSRSDINKISFIANNANSSFRF